jgi:hypothetical protein
MWTQDYNRLLNLNQWKTNDPDSTIIVLQAGIKDLIILLQATNSPLTSGQPK